MTALVSNLPVFTGYFYGAIAAVAAFTDYQNGKIYNWLTLPAILAGLILTAIAGGLHGFTYALEGFAVAGLLFIPLYVTKVLGAGDVKLCMALSTVLGPHGAIELVLLSLTIAAAGAVALLIKHGRVKIFFSEIYNFAISVYTRGLEIHWPQLSRDIKAPFGIALFLGFICLLVR